MFIWPDSIPPGAEFIILALIPLGVLVIAHLPLAATLQIGVITGVLIATTKLARRKELHGSWLVAGLPAAFVVSTFATNLMLLFWRSLT